MQKVVAVSDHEQLEEIEKETQALPSEFRNAFAFCSIAEIQQVSDYLQAAMTIISKLGLAPGRT